LLTCYYSYVSSSVLLIDIPMLDFMLQKVAANLFLIPIFNIIARYYDMFDKL